MQKYRNVFHYNKERNTMRFQGAVIREQSVTFAVVVVKKRVVDDRSQASQVIDSFQPIFPGMPIVLMAQSQTGPPTYYGRRDITRFLSKVPVQAIPWKEYTIRQN